MLHSTGSKRFSEAVNLRQQCLNKTHASEERCESIMVNKVFWN
jgi:hypothetical protein